MNAMNQINQGAAIILMSETRALRLGIDRHKFIYLHGAADTIEKPLSTRSNFHSSEAMRLMAEQVFFGGDLSMRDISFIDFYSCFPSAVEFARDAFGVAPDDPRPLTVTGGLPFHGGAGNNYVMNSIASMIDRLREQPESFGVVTANGGYFSKHSAGIYSTARREPSWSRTPPEKYQTVIDSIPDVSFTENPSGEAVVETYTVLFDRENRPSQGLVVGRIGKSFDDRSSPRFFSIVEGDSFLLESMTKQDMVGEKGRVYLKEGLNRFKF
jgi:acetyl-CoA C-acetyltransferase